MSTPSAAPSEWVWLARIRRSQGRKGEVFADILTDFPEKFAERRHLWLIPDESLGASSMAQPHRAMDGNPPVPRQIELIHHWQHKGGIVLHFAGIDSISAAETLAGLIVAIPRSQRAALPEDEFHIADLIGCTLIEVSATPPVIVGAIDNVDRTAGPAPLLIVRTAKGEALIPFAKAYLRNIDIAKKQVEMALPEGLLDLNA